MGNEPIRWTVYIAAVLGALSGLLIDVSNAVPLLEALGKSLALLVPVVAGAEVARAHVDGPDTAAAKDERLAKALVTQGQLESRALEAEQALIVAQARDGGESNP